MRGTDSVPPRRIGVSMTPSSAIWTVPKAFPNPFKQSNAAGTLSR